MSNKDLNTLMDDLTGGLEPVCTLAHPLKRALITIAVSLIYVSAVIYYLEFRSDIVELMTTSHFIFEITLVAALFISACFATAWMCVPDMRGQAWIIAVPLTLFGTFLSWIGIEAYFTGFTIPHIHFHHCALDGGIVASLPTAVLVFMSTRGGLNTPYIILIHGHAGDERPRVSMPALYLYEQLYGTYNFLSCLSFCDWRGYYWRRCTTVLTSLLINI